MSRILVGLALLLHAATVRAEIAIHDDRGRDLILDSPAQRIVSLAPHLTELLFDAGAGTKLVGTAALSDYPPSARAVPVIGDSAAIDVERIMALKPDVVLAWMSGNPPAEVAKLEQLGIRVLVTEPHSLQAIADDIDQKLSAAGVEPKHTEGYNQADWVLMDYVDFVVHIFSESARKFYDLERL